MADRDYETAAELLGRAEPHAAHRDRLRKQRILALGLGGKSERAAELLWSASRSTLGGPWEGAEWGWLAARFGLTPSSAIAPGPRGTGSKHFDSPPPPG